MSKGEAGETRAARELQLPFRDRRDAGRILAAALHAHRGRPATVVLGVPRGGMVVAAEVAHGLGLPLDALSPQALGGPFPDRPTVILVDDGVATGATAIPAIQALRRRGVARLIFATPVAPSGTAVVLHGLVDELVVLAMPRNLHSVGFFYDDFAPVSDADVLEILGHPAGIPPAAGESHALA